MCRRAYLSIWSPIIRVIYTVAMIIKSRCPQARTILFLIDEAGQLGKFEALLKAFTFGRGAGVRAWALFQDKGQIERNFDRAAVSGFLGSAQMRQFFGVRDYETAKLVSDMLGEETLEYDAKREQEEARRRKRKAAQDVLMGGDPFQAANDYAHFSRGSSRRTKQARRLLTPDEVLNLPEDAQILFISGKNLGPVLAEKRPYYEQRFMAGRYLPNPFHPPSDKVRIQTRLGARWAAVRSGPVPEHFAGFPQYDGGQALWVEGYPLG